MRQQLDYYKHYASVWDKRYFETTANLPTLTNKQVNEAKIRLTKYINRIPLPRGQGSPQKIASHATTLPSLISTTGESLILDLPDDLGNTIYDLVPGTQIIENQYLIPIRNSDLAANLIQPYDPDLANDILTNKHTKKWHKKQKVKQDLQHNDAAHLLTSLKERLVDFLPKNLILFPHQVEAIAFFIAATGRSILADEPGLGKTAPAIVFNAINKYKTVVLCPKNVLINWATEINMWSPSSTIHILTKTTKQDQNDFFLRGIEISNELPDEPPDFLITNYERNTKEWQRISELGFDSIIWDECHNLKNPQAKRTINALALASACPQSLIGLSGTPIRNRPDEFYTILKKISYNDFPSYEDYIKRYCGAYKGDYGWRMGKPTNMPELYKKIQRIMLRRGKDVLDLPSKEIVKTPVKFVLNEYNSLFQQLVTDLRYKEGGPLTIIQKLRIYTGKLKANFLINDSRKLPLVIFYHHKEVGDILQSRFPSALRIDGSTSQVKRSIIVDDFQRGETDILLASIQAAGIGITLTRAKHLIMLERSWVPGDELQCHDRIHRIGQQHPVTIEYPLIDNTIDTVMDAVISEKLHNIGGVIDGKVSESMMIKNVFKELMK